MTLKNTDDRWGAVSQLFHWVIVALILVMAYIGLTMGDLPNGPRKINIYALHKSIGLTILALGWRYPTMMSSSCRKATIHAGHSMVMRCTT